ncbi:PREDICTED: lateral signaling target protein 2 homolog [Ipomoea nil]|uniref:lateral signaling target protein 2 homolog n=1 Tax=Ipomoea nil TaxID=35883 RepID=UPI000900B5FE|nr:PREDICTED: lateral signaling target protein 2 homolog [Ipomoea nil]
MGSGFNLHTPKPKPPNLKTSYTCLTIPPLNASLSIPGNPILENYNPSIHPNTQQNLCHFSSTQKNFCIFIISAPQKDSFFLCKSGGSSSRFDLFMESGGMYSSMGSGMLGLEMSLHHQNPNHIQQQQQSMVAFDHHHHHQSQPAAKPGVYGYGGKPKAQGLTLSDEDEPAGGPTADQSSAEDGKRKMSPWQRMKWTDDMVKLLIMVVYYIGDEGVPDGGANEKKGGHGGGVLQKKGKWKSVSRAMMERGFSVSPQQCEDKFNDLNKRYKRVNDILGKGTACRVVENQSLLESMDLSPKMKEEVKKLLNSKHLFFREMCAYHNSCSHGGATAGTAADGSSEPPAPQQNCLHSNESARIESNLAVKAPEEGCESDQEESDSDEEDDDHGVEEEEEQGSRKRQKKTGSFSPMLQQLSTELTNLCQDGTRSPLEKRHWIRARMMQLEEQQIGFDSQKLELAKQRLKWEKYSSKKEREMEKEKLTNERKRLENDRMVILLQQKELELLDHLHHQRTTDPSHSVTG